jgi:hypothetical protein
MFLCAHQLSFQEEMIMLKRSPATVVPACLALIVLVLLMIPSGCVGGSAVPVSGGTSSGSGGSSPGGGNPALAAYLPNPQLTPGDTLDVTKADVCEPVGEHNDDNVFA